MMGLMYLAIYMSINMVQMYHWLHHR